ncbi:MAG TPA: TIGR03435 family protein [Vicinamibacterales bacterium]
MSRPTIILIVTVLAGRLLAQSSPVPAFDVASVKPSESRDAESASFVQPGGRYIATNVTLRMLLKSAYGLHDDQLVGGPSWISSDGFDIAAKAEGYSTPSAFRDQARLMLRPLLTDRFKLVIRREQRDLPVYALAKAGKVLGQQIRVSDPRACEGAAKAMPTPPLAAEPEAPLPCGAEIYRPGHLAARGMAFSFFVLNVSRYTDRVVVDRTGLAGKFDWDVQWVPDALAVNGPSPPDGPALFVALREQAGLKVERRRGSVEVFVIAHAEKPDPD